VYRIRKPGVQHYEENQASMTRRKPGGALYISTRTPSTPILHSSAAHTSKHPNPYVRLPPWLRRPPPTLPPSGGPPYVRSSTSSPWTPSKTARTTSRIWRWRTSSPRPWTATSGERGVRPLLFYLYPQLDHRRACLSVWIITFRHLMYRRGFLRCCRRPMHGMHAAEFANKLIHAGIGVDDPAGSKRRGPLHLAAASGKADICALLIEDLDANVNATDVEGYWLLLCTISIPRLCLMI
jgi:hypothetical protein